MRRSWMGWTVAGLIVLGAGFALQEYFRRNEPPQNRGWWVEPIQPVAEEQGVPRNREILLKVRTNRVQPFSVKMNVNGEDVTPTFEPGPGYSTMRYAPPEPWHYSEQITVLVLANDSLSGEARRHEYAFRTVECGGLARWHGVGDRMRAPWWTNAKAISPGCYSNRDLTLKESDKGVFDPPRFGTFDRPYPEGNKCESDPTPPLATEEDKLFFIYIPEGDHASYKLFVSVHGTSKGQPFDPGDPASNRALRYFSDVVFNNSDETYRKEFMDEHGIVVVAPQFKFYSPKTENGIDWKCGRETYDNFVTDWRDHRSDMWLLSLLDYVAQEVEAQLGTPVESNRFYIYGHSRGGQFVSAFVQAHPERIERAVSAGTPLYYENVTIHPDFTDLRTRHGTSWSFGSMLLGRPGIHESTAWATVMGTTDPRLCANLRLVCGVVSEYCDYQPSDWYSEVPAVDAANQPLYDCEEQVWNQDGECYAENGERPTAPGEGECLFRAIYVQGGHDGANNYPPAATFLFEDLTL